MFWEFKFVVLVFETGCSGPSFRDISQASYLVQRVVLVVRCWNWQGLKKKMSVFGKCVSHTCTYWIILDVWRGKMHNFTFQLSHVSFVLMSVSVAMWMFSVVGLDWFRFQRPLCCLISFGCVTATLVKKILWKLYLNLLHGSYPTTLHFLYCEIWN